MQKFTQFLKDPETPPKNELDTKFGFTGFRTTKDSGFDDSLNKINKELFQWLTEFNFMHAFKIHNIEVWGFGVLDLSDPIYEMFDV